ncbi:MAG: right-handed parallel beta-helix repeat-containing protein, partial [Candidatus Thermoplasmatota archaeon]
DISVSDCIVRDSMEGIRVSYGRNIDISNCTIYGNADGSVELWDSSFVDVSDCVIFDNGGEYSGGILIIDAPDREGSCNNITISSCRIYNNTRDGVTVYDNCEDIEVFSNFIANNTQNGISVSRFCSVDIVDNRVVGNGDGGYFDSGLFISDCRGSVYVSGNVFEGNDNYGIYLLRSSKNVVKNNVFVDNVDSGGFFIVRHNLYNCWDGNFWGSYRGFGPKPVLGRISIQFNFDLNDNGLLDTLPVPWVNFDWHPASEL